MDEEDPFAEVGVIPSGEDDQDDLEANVHRDTLARMCSFVDDLLDGMGAEADELAIRDGCLYLVRPRLGSPSMRLRPGADRNLCRVSGSQSTLHQGPWLAGSRGVGPEHSLAGARQLRASNH